MAGMDPLYSLWICRGCVANLNGREYELKPDQDPGLFTAKAKCWRCGITTKCAPDNQVAYPNHVHF